jgi:aminoglycoside phosphotransferase (APT) family kinase protein
VSSTLPPLVDTDALADYLNQHLPGNGLRVHRHQAGHSNETFFVTWGGRELVLRRPPRGAFLPSAHDVAREYRVLSALERTPVRAPTTVLLCEDESVIGAPFYLMERIDGVVIRNELPDSFDEPEQEKIGHELVDALAELHAVDYESCGLETFGKPHGYLERQVRRWSGQLELTLPLTRPVPDLERVAEWLRSNLPDSPAATIVHGDYKLDNVMLAPNPPARLIAIVDWEMSTIGDPLADVGWMISFWREAEDPTHDVFADLHSVTGMRGFSRRDALVRRYVELTGRDVSALEWYQVLAVWKLAILLEGSYARHLAGMTDDPFFARMEHAVPALAREAVQRMQRA